MFAGGRGYASLCKPDPLFPVHQKLSHFIQDYHHFLFEQILRQLSHTLDSTGRLNSGP